MTIQTGAATALVFGREAAFGAKPAPSAGTLLRRIASTLGMTRPGQRSNEIRGDGQSAGFRPGNRRVEGEIRVELAAGGADELLAAALRGTWAAGVATSVAVTADAAERRFVRTAGSWIADGFRVGDVVRWSGLSPGNDGRNLRIVALSAAAMTVAEAVEEAAATASCSVAGRKLVMGGERPSFTVEHAYGEAGFSQLFTGCRVGGLDLSLAPGRLAELTLPLVGRDMEVVDGPAYFAAPAPPPRTPPLAAVDAALRVDGREVGVATALELSVDLDLAADAVVGAEAVPEVCYGRSTAGGSLTVFVEDAGLLQSFVSGGDSSLHLLLAPKGGSGFVSVHLPRVVFTGGEVRLQGAEGLPLRLPFQALVKEGDPAFDAVTIVLQACDD